MRFPALISTRGRFLFSSPAKSLAVIAFGAVLLALPVLLKAQTVVSVGNKGSYASQVPSAEWFTDSYYGLPAAQTEPMIGGTTAIFSSLHMDPSLVGKPIPTNHWWTDMLIANRSSLPAGSNTYVLKQDPYGGNMWFYPGMLDPQSYGMDLYFPNAWSSGSYNGNPNGSINKGPALSVKGDVPYSIPAGDVLIADFENGYPAGTVRTGNAFASTPSTGSGYTGMIGNYCANTRDGNDSVTGTCTLPSFTVTKNYVSFLIAGGNWPGTSVNLIVGGQTVLTASGQDDLTFRWVTWDISPWAGQTATIQIVDSVSGGWGVIAADQFVESDSNNPVGRYGGDMVATNSVVTNWGDWNVDFKLPDPNGHEVDVTMARGIPFTWTTWKGGMNPKIVLGSTTLYDVNGAVLSGSTITTNAFSFNYQGRVFGVFLPDNTTVKVTSTYAEPQLSGSNNYMVVGYLPATTNLAEFAAVAFARPTNTQISWSYDPVAGLANTTWNVTTTAMKGSNLQTIQGWLPHHYRTTTNSLSFKSYTYLTARGVMKCTQGNTFNIGFPFKGIAPVLPAPISTGTVNDYRPAVMSTLMNKFDPGTMLGDTYWSGKGLAICAQYMAWANQLGDATNYNRLKSALETAMDNWLTYTPGETNGYFSYYPNWHALIGSSASYGSQSFNDLHFHYGYFATAAATLGIYDPQFLTDYGPMIRDVVKCYGNYDRTDQSEPFLRTFDVWEGHDNAGGMSSGNGENQESSSEGVQAWGGMFLLGSVLNDSQMQAAGATFFAMESAAVNEYWQDLWNTNLSPGYGRQECGILSADSVAYGTYFDGDPAWVYAIQYCPSNHWLNYMTRYNPSTVSSKYQAMWTERSNWCAGQTPWTSTGTFAAGKWVQYNQKIYSVSGTNPLPAGQPSPDVNPSQWALQADCTKNEPDVLGDSPGHVVLVYQALWDHDNAAAEFDRYYAANEDIATSAGDGGSSYYLIHGLRVLGDQDFNYTTSIPTSAVYLNSTTGTRTYVVYNPLPASQQTVIYNNGIATGTMTVPGYATVSTVNPNYVPTAPSAPSGLTAVAGYSQAALSWNRSPGATSYNIKRATVSGGPYTITGTSDVTAFTDAAVVSGSSYYYVVSAVNSIGESANSSEAAANIPVPPLVAIDCGGAAVSPFSADASYSGGSASTTANSISTAGLVSPAPMAVYQSNRFGSSTYTIGGLTPSTNYTVRLHFSENYWGAANSRLTNVTINGTRVLSSFNIFATAGGKNIATIQQFTMPSNASGQFVIQFATVKDNAQINGIEILAPVPAPVITGSLSVPANIGAPFTYQIAATNHPSQYGATGLPAGLTVDNNGGAITGTPSATGTSSVPISAANIGGTATATLVISVRPPAPVVNTVQGSQTVASGSGATLAITATGTGPFTYQWYKGAAPIQNATASSYTIASTGSGDAGTYSVAVTDANGSTTTSGVFTLAVNSNIPFAPRWAQAAVALLLLLAAARPLLVK